jgi:predicted transcriptional regulator
MRELQRQILDVLAEHTDTYPSTARMLYAEEIAEHLEMEKPRLDSGPSGRVPANLRVLRNRGLVLHEDGPGTGRWQITRAGRAALK